MTLRDELVRAATYKAFDERDEHGRVTTAAAKRIEDAHVYAPLFEYGPVINAVTDWLDACRRQDEAAELAWYAELEQRLYPKGLACAA